MTTATKNKIINKLDNLPADVLVEVEDFIDFLTAKIEKQKEVEPQTLAEPKGLYGAAKGTILYISEEFNKPLDEMKDCM